MKPWNSPALLACRGPLITEPSPQGFVCLKDFLGILPGNLPTIAALRVLLYLYLQVTLQALLNLIHLFLVLGLEIPAFGSLLFYRDVHPPGTGNKQNEKKDYCKKSHVVII